MAFTTWSTLDYEELEGSPTWSLGAQGPRAQRRFKVAHASLDHFLDNLCDYYEPVPGGGWYFPAPAVALDNAHLANVQVHRFGGNAVVNNPAAEPTSAHNTYAFYEVIADYDPTPDFFVSFGASSSSYSLPPADGACYRWPAGIVRPTYTKGTTLKVLSRLSGEFLVFPPRIAAWETASSSAGDSSSSSGDAAPRVPPDSPAGRFLIPHFELRTEWSRLKAPPMGAHRDFVGHVNATAFLGCEPETLLFEGEELEEHYTPSRTAPFRFRLLSTFRQRYIKVGGFVYGWNHDLREDPFGWRRVTLPDGSYRYPLAEFANFFVE